MSVVTAVSQPWKSFVTNDCERLVLDACSRSSRIPPNQLSNPMSAVHVARPMNGAVVRVTVRAGWLGLSAARTLAGSVGCVTSAHAAMAASREVSIERLRMVWPSSAEDAFACAAAMAARRCLCPAA